MELRDFAEQVLFATSLELKLASPSDITDDKPGAAIVSPSIPGRPLELRFKLPNSRKTKVPGIESLDKPAEKGRLLHFFANHELLATELMALVLLRFPDAPRAFRRMVFQTLKDEQEHTRWYMERMHQCGVQFGEHPLSGYFWRAISNMQSPLDYVAGLSLTFEQANLDFAHFYSRAFASVGDLPSASLLERIYRDEIVHVAGGLKWFRLWKDAQENDWTAFRRHLKFPLSPQRAKGPIFNPDGRVQAGFDLEFIQELNTFAQSKGRTPAVFVFNPFAEGHIALGQAFTPNKHQQLLQQDLETLPQFLCRQDDVVLVRRSPSSSFLTQLKDQGFIVPEFHEVGDAHFTSGDLSGRKLSSLHPWAWGPDSLELLGPLFGNLTSGSEQPENYFNQTIAQLYSKEWSARFLSRLLAEIASNNSIKTSTRQTDSAWLCSEHDVGLGCSSMDQVLTQVQSIRARGHHNVILKQSLGVAGHNSIRILEPDVLDNQRRWISNALDHGCSLVVEPWLERIADFSIQLQMNESGLKTMGYSGLLNDWKGQYRGNVASPDFPRRIHLPWARLFHGIRDISARVLKFYSNAFRILEAELNNISYRGPLGLDAFVYRAATGECRVKPIVEINPRYTMGRLTLELMRNVTPGSTGTFQLVTRRHLKSEGFENFSSWARAVRARFPIKHSGNPSSKIRSGRVFLTDPDCANVCLGVFDVTEPGLTNHC